MKTIKELEAETSKINKMLDRNLSTDICLSYRLENIRALKDVVKLIIKMQKEHPKDMVLWGYLEELKARIEGK